MAEEERRWRQRHTHESNAISYGTLGTASYHETLQQWTFLRNDPFERDLNVEENGAEEDSVSLLRVLSDPETVARSTYEDDTPRQTTIDTTLYYQYPELAAASSTIQAILQSETGIGNSRTANHAVSFGHAVWLGPGGTDSGNLTVPVTAHVSGPGRDSLHITCVGRQSFEHTSKDGVSSSMRIPSLLGDSHTSWAGVMPIQQIVFSQRDSDGHGGTFLAVQQASQTSIFEPLLRRDAYANTFSLDRSSLDPNRLLALPRSHTGGQDHVDICFHPQDQRKLAVVDVEGNWSIWYVQGRRTHTARVLYRIVLQASNKIFSWEHKKRPENAELYFDGWHRVLWVSASGESVDRVLVCNRQDAKLFDAKGTNKNEICSIDVRLDTRKENSYILDMQLGTNPNLCLILTTSRLLVFDFAQEEWKDTRAPKGPALLCAWRHFQSASNFSLRMAVVGLGKAMLIALYSNISRTMRVYLMRSRIIDGKVCVAFDDPSTFHLPEGLPESPIASLTLATLETAGHEQHASRQRPRLFQIITQHEDLSIATITAELSELGVSQTDRWNPILRLPPNRNTQRSERLVDKIDDEADLAGFIVADEDVKEDEYEESEEDVRGMRHDELCDPSEFNKRQKEVRVVLRRMTAGKSGADAMAKVLSVVMHRHSTSRHDMSQALEAFEQRLKDLSAMQDVPHAVLLSDLFDKDTRVEDIETDSATLERAIHMTGSAIQDRLQISTSNNEHSQPLLRTYENLFEVYVHSLNVAVPDRIRVQRERQARDVALDLYLSSRTAVSRLPSAKRTPTEEGDAVPDSDPLVFSDPIMQQDPSSRKTPAQISASQPVPRPPSSQASKPSAQPPPPPAPAWEDAVARLSRYTRISSRTPAAALQESANAHILSVLAHLPESADADPDEYDWQATELKLAAREDTSGGKSKDKRAERLARARKRAGDILPVRSAERRTPDIQRSETQTQTQLETMSEGIGQPAQSSSQGMLHSGMTLTQPARGAFANREKQKKKKKRVAGF